MWNTPWHGQRESALLLLIAMPGNVGLTGAVSNAQELTPRAYWPAPNGTKVATFAYQYSTGDILMDPSLPIVGVDSRINLTQFSYLQTINLAGRTAQVQFSVHPIHGARRRVSLKVWIISRYIAGWADARARLSVNLLGAPTMDGAQFQQLRAKPKTHCGMRVCSSVRLRPVPTRRRG